MLWTYDWKTSLPVAAFHRSVPEQVYMLHRHQITDQQWEVIRDFLPGKKGDRGATAKDNRLFVDAVMWIAKTGAPWRDLPARFGKWDSVYQRFNRWCKSGVFQKLMHVLQEPDLEILMLDSTVIRAHQHAAGAEGSTAEAEALGRSRGGFSTKIHLGCDAVGQPVKIILTPGQDHDVTQAQELIKNVDAEKVIADKAYDSDELINAIKASGAKVVTPPKSNRCEQRSYSKRDYKKRNVVERLVNTLKQCRRVATRYEKTARNFLAMIQLASIFVLLN